jgi:hypothetical protein
MNGKGSLAQYQLKIAITDGEKQVLTFSDIISLRLTNLL